MAAPTGEKLRRKRPREAAAEIRAFFFRANPADPHGSMAKAFATPGCSACSGVGILERFASGRPYLAHCECVRKAIRRAADELVATGKDYAGPEGST